MKLQITIPSPSPDLPEEVYNIDCPFDKTAHWRVKKQFKDRIWFVYVLTTNTQNFEAKYINN